MTEDNAWSIPDTVLDNGISFEYDTLGRLATESSSVGGKAIGKSYNYNQFGAETGFTLTVDGIAELEKISAYDDFLRLKSVTQDGKTTTYTYDDNGNLVTETTGDVVTTYSYNDSNMVVSMGTTADGTAVTNFNYLYNRNGNQRQKIETVTNTVTKFEYDLIGQLTSERNTAGEDVILADLYWYDASGNRTLKNEYRPNENGSLASKFIRSTYNKNNQLTATYTDGVENVYAYDTVGNMVADGGKGYTYTTRNQQKTFTNGDTSASYTYYYDGLRKSKAVNGTTTYFIWHNGNMVYEFTSTGSNSYTYGLRLISSDDEKFVLNAHGDVVALLNDSGAVTKRYDYDAFGNELNPSASDTNPFRYCAEYFDTETGTIYLRARYYSPVIGRFTQLDPIKDGLNWYAYCSNNPIIFVDSSGEAIETIFDIAGVAWSFADFLKNPSLINAAFLVWDVASVVIPVVPGSYVAKGGKLFIKAGAKADDVVDAFKVLKAADRADAIKDGAVVMKYSDLAKLTKGTKLQAHHLIEKRFTNILSKINPNDIPSIAIDADTHSKITKLFREKIPYRNKGNRDKLNTYTASVQKIWDTIRETYIETGMTEYLDELQQVFKDYGYGKDITDWGEW